MFGVYAGVVGDVLLNVVHPGIYSKRPDELVQSNRECVKA